jgi:hypothetical protein
MSSVVAASSSQVPKKQNAVETLPIVSTTFPILLTKRRGTFLSDDLTNVDARIKSSNPLERVQAQKTSSFQRQPSTL